MNDTKNNNVITNDGVKEDGRLLTAYPHHTAGITKGELKVLKEKYDDSKIANVASKNFEPEMVKHVVDLCNKMGVKKIPKVIISESNKVNATSVRGDSLIISRGLINTMSTGELRSVIGHELSHHKNSFINGATETAIYVGTAAPLYVAGTTAGNHVVENSKLIENIKRPNVKKTAANTIYSAIAGTMLLISHFVATLPVRYFRRHTELEADRQGAAASSTEDMISALEKIGHKHKRTPEEDSKETLWQKTKSFVKSLYRKHPPIEERIAKLRGTIDDNDKKKYSTVTNTTSQTGANDIDAELYPKLSLEVPVNIVPLDNNISDAEHKGTYDVAENRQIS